MDDSIVLGLSPKAESTLGYTNVALEETRTSRWISLVWPWRCPELTLVEEAFSHGPGGGLRSGVAILTQKPRWNRRSGYDSPAWINPQSR